MDVSIKALVIIIFVTLASYLLLGEPNNKSIKKNERYYQEIMCEELSGETEVVLFDKTRVDCLTDDYAIEVDWAKKWAEAIGQSLYYAEVTGKKPAIGLIMSNSKADERHLRRLTVITEKLNINVIRLEK